jgi:tRNA (guanine37-N1)-methyltransferase
LIDVQRKKFTDYVAPKERIDAPTCGHSAGMVIRPEVIERAIQERESTRGVAYKIFFSPHGTLLDQQLLKQMYVDMQSKNVDHLLLVAGRYEGMDARVEEIYADAVVSIGNFVLMGGDLPAMIFLEGFARLIPKVVGRQESVENDSFYGPFVDYPEYSLPVVWQGLQVPDVLRSGNHQQIADWRLQKSVERTVLCRFNWMRSFALTKNEKKLARTVIPPHCVVLMHNQVLVGKQRIEGHTSVTSIDIHDIARSAHTYGLEHFFIVTSLEDQHAIVKQFLYFWQQSEGIEYNHTRHEALERVKIMHTLDDVMEWINQNYGQKPLQVVTSAQKIEGVPVLTFVDQETVWKHNKPVLFILGTGQGLAPSMLSKADYALVPLEGLSEYNHLSVRSAASVIFDRWLGISQKAHY